MYNFEQLSTKKKATFKCY